jgi:hypothetical protein
MHCIFIISSGLKTIFTSSYKFSLLTVFWRNCAHFWLFQIWVPSKVLLDATISSHLIYVIEKYFQSLIVVKIDMALPPENCFNRMHCHAVGRAF